MPKMKRYSSVPEYLASLEGSTKQLMKELIAIADEELPGAERTFSYGIPTYKLDGKNIVHFMAYQSHIGLYPGPMAIAEFSQQLKDYKTSKGTIQLPHNKPLPTELVRKIIRFSQQTQLKIKQ